MLGRKRYSMQPNMELICSQKQNIMVKNSFCRFEIENPGTQFCNRKP